MRGNPNKIREVRPRPRPCQQHMVYNMWASFCRDLFSDHLQDTEETTPASCNEAPLPPIQVFGSMSDSPSQSPYLPNLSLPPNLITSGRSASLASLSTSDHRAVLPKPALPLEPEPLSGGF